MSSEAFSTLIRHHLAYQEKLENVISKAKDMQRIIDVTQWEESEKELATIRNSVIELDIAYSILKSFATMKFQNKEN